MPKVPFKTTSRLILLSISLCFMTLFISSCKDKKDNEPAYYYIDSFTLKTESNNSQGTEYHDIVDGWVYKGGELIGVFELPATVPILGVDTATITVLPGIKRNAKSNDRTNYPFFIAHEQEVILKPNNYDSIFPKTEYRTATKFLWLEDFEDHSISLVGENKDATVDSVELVTDSNFVVNYNSKNRVSAKLTFPKGKQYMEVRSISTFEITRNKPVFLEFDYKTGTDIQVGIFAIENGKIKKAIPILILFETTEWYKKGYWKKAYISLSEDINVAEYNGMKFRVFFSTVTDKEEEVNFLIDNIKLLAY